MVVEIMVMEAADMEEITVDIITNINLKQF